MVPNWSRSMRNTTPCSSVPFVDAEAVLGMLRHHGACGLGLVVDAALRVLRLLHPLQRCIVKFQVGKETKPLSRGRRQRLPFARTTRYPKPIHSRKPGIGTYHTESPSNHHTNSCSDIITPPPQLTASSTIRARRLAVGRYSKPAVFLGDSRQVSRTSGRSAVAQLPHSRVTR